MKAHASLHQHDGLLNPSDGGGDFHQYHDEVQLLLEVTNEYKIEKGML